MSHPQEMENSEGKLPNAPEKQSEGIDEKLMWVINIAGENAPDTLEDKVQGETRCCGGGGSAERRGWGEGVSHRGSTVSLPGSGTPGSSDILPPSVMLPMGQDCKCPLGRGHGDRDAPSASASELPLWVSFGSHKWRCR